MNVTVTPDGKTLIVEAETVGEGFMLGSLWEECSDNGNVAWSGDAILHFDLRLPTPKDEKEARHP